jgi:hypothetical protein
LGKESGKLTQLASDKGITFRANTPESLKKLRNRLEPLEKEVFDTRWLTELTALSRESVANFEAGAKSSDKEIKAYAEEGLALAKERMAVLEKLRH